MHRSREFRSPACRLVAGLSMVWPLLLSARPISADEPVHGKALYHSDPQHLWNRLHDALLVRIGPDGREYGHDRLDPLLWTETVYLLENQSRDRAVALLQEFLIENGEKLVAEPIKRAALQRDLWLIFNWLERDHGDEQRLSDLLASVIGRLALTPEQIQGLPDNYAAAVASGEFATSFDPERPGELYLPADLFAPDGAWVCVGRLDGPVAPQHVRDDSGNNPSTNSVFLVFLRLPGGRGATLNFLNQLRLFDQPFLVKSDDAGNRRHKFLANENLPLIPAGTEMALVRRALLIDSSNTPVPSAITESIQLRVYREAPEITAQTLDASLVSGTAANRRARQWQSFYEFRMSRQLLFAGRAGGLRAIGGDERDFKTGFRAYDWDPFERRQADGSFPGAYQQPIRQNCFGCHSLPGIMSFNSFSDDWRGGLVSGDMRRPAALSNASVAEAVASGIESKKHRRNWTALRRLLSKKTIGVPQAR